jgi:Helix-turn-helix domain
MDWRSLATDARPSHNQGVDPEQLADFLRHRREALQPEDVRLARSPRRRTSGLRREEVALLASMSTDYYTRLEQQRGPQPSPPMLAAIGRARRLTLAERDHLYRLAGHTPVRGQRSRLAAPACAARAAERADLVVPRAAVDPSREHDRASPDRSRLAGGRDRAGRCDALPRRGRNLARPQPPGVQRRPPAADPSARPHAAVRGGWSGNRALGGLGRELGPARRGPARFTDEFGEAVWSYC